jgi:hypothetical protein
MKQQQQQDLTLAEFDVLCIKLEQHLELIQSIPSYTLFLHPILVENAVQKDPSLFETLPHALCGFVYENLHRHHLAFLESTPSITLNMMEREPYLGFFPYECILWDLIPISRLEAFLCSSFRKNLYDVLPWALREEHFSLLQAVLDSEASVMWDSIPRKWKDAAVRYAEADRYRWRFLVAWGIFKESRAAMREERFQQAALAFSMAQQTRLGKNSSAHALPTEMHRLIVESMRAP